MEKQYCITETSAVIWSEKIQDECRFSRGTELIAEKSKSFVMSKHEVLVVTITDKVKECNLEMWTTQQNNYVDTENWQ